MLRISPKDPRFPADFRRLHQAPSALYIEGEQNWSELLTRPKLAVVGSRKASTYGQAVTEQLVRAVASRGVVIVSGLALGTDSIAHRACLTAGGQTIAIISSGLQLITPRSHEQLAHQIVTRGGAVISEQPPHTEPRKWSFVARNRLIAALADAVLIPEAAEKSGSLHTAAFALETGKEVLAVPGPITSSLSTGTNNLIKAGARMVTSAQDIVDALGVRLPPKQLTLHGTDEELAILRLLQNGIHDAEVLQPKSGLDPITFQQTLTMLEISGRIRAIGANMWTTI